MKWTKAETDFIDPLRVARLATVDAGGMPHNVPICPLFFDGKIYFGTEVNAKKVRNIKTNPNVALAFDDYTDAWQHLHGIMVQGRARVVGPKEFLRLRRKFYYKYLHYESTSPLKDDDSAIVEVEPLKKFSWGL